VIFREIIMTYATKTDDDEPKGELALRTLAGPGDTNPVGDIFDSWLMGQYGYWWWRCRPSAYTWMRGYGCSRFTSQCIGDVVYC